MIAKIVKYKDKVILPEINSKNQFCDLKIDEDCTINYNDDVTIKLGYGFIYDNKYKLLVDYNSKLIDDTIKISTSIEPNGAEIVVNIVNNGNKIVKLQKGETLLKLNSVENLCVE